MERHLQAVAGHLLEEGEFGLEGNQLLLLGGLADVFSVGGMKALPVIPPLFKGQIPDQAAAPGGAGEGVLLRRRRVDPHLDGHIPFHDLNMGTKLRKQTGNTPNAYKKKEHLDPSLNEGGCGVNLLKTTILSKNFLASDRCCQAKSSFFSQKALKLLNWVDIIWSHW